MIHVLKRLWFLICGIILVNMALIMVIAVSMLSTVLWMIQILFSSISHRELAVDKWGWFDMIKALKTLWKIPSKVFDLFYL